MTLAEKKDLSTALFLVWFTTGLSYRELGVVFDVSAERAKNIVGYNQRKMRIATASGPSRPHPPWFKRLKKAGALRPIHETAGKDLLTCRYTRLEVAQPKSSKPHLPNRTKVGPLSMKE